MNKTPESRPRLLRGGASKGPFFQESGLPADVATREMVLLAIVGSPGKREIDETRSSRGLMRRET